jgi:hypothetical protein
MSPTISNPRRPVYIDLQSSHDFYTNNDVVRGAVRVHPTERPKAVKLTFKGRCKTMITTDNGKTVHKSTLELFSYERTLFSSSVLGESYEIVGMGIGRDGKVKLPFEFTFPNNVRMPPGKLYKERPGLFEHQPGHPLPTSCGYAIGRGFRSDGNRVEYILEARIYKKSTCLPDDTIFLKLPFRPRPPLTDTDLFVEHPRFSEFLIRTHRLHPNHNRNPNALTRLKWSLTRDSESTPMARWKLVAQCPYRLVAGARVPVSFSLCHLNRSCAIPEIPTVYVRQIGVKLTSILTTRIPYQGFSGDRDIVDSNEVVIVNKVFVGRNNVLRNGLQLAELGGLDLAPTILPSFRTYGLRLEYRIKIVIDGECAMETFRVTALRGRCEVVSNVRREGNGSSVAIAMDEHIPAPLDQAREEPNSEEQLPAYEQAPNYEQTSPRVGCVSEDDTLER